MYRRINPQSRQELGLRMLFQPTGGGVFFKACEADGYGGLVAAILDDPTYEAAPAIERLVQRLRLAHDVALLIKVGNDRRIEVADRDVVDAVNVISDERFIRSLHRLGFVSLDPSLADREDRRG